jgi:amino acid adenylation domain-containing protein
MDLNSLLTNLSNKGIKLSVNGDSLLVDVPKGVMTPELRDSLSEHKAEILLMLRQHSMGASSTALPVIVPAPEQRYEPFPLTDMQHAFWVGRSGAIELGGVSNHGYYEIEGNDLNLERLNWALQQLIKRHDMLRAVVLSDGQQQILEQVPAYPFEVLDLTGQDEAFVKAQLEAIRQRMSHQVLPSDRWPLFDFRATCLDNGRVRLHISYDLLVFDAWSLFRLFEEWFQLYQNPEVALPPLELSFRDYALAEQGLRETELYKRSQNYWLSRIDSLPPAPDLPLAKNPHQLKQHRVKRYEGGIERTHWQQLKQCAAKAGLTPSGVLLAAFAEIMTLWSKNPQFTLNLALFNRLPLHPQVNDLLGDFTSVTLLGVDNSEAESFSNRAIRLQKQLWQDLEHRYFSGVRVTRELSRRKGAAPNAMPVIFTSTLGFGSLGQETRTFSHFGELVYGISQASQAWMDIQVWEEKGTLTFNWDVVEELFPEGLIEEMFEAYCHFLKQLASSESAWVETTRQLLPPAQLAQRNAINATEASISDELLHTLFAAQVQARGNELAIISPERNLTYQELCDRSNQVGHRLRKLGATPNKLVAVVMEKGWEQIVAVMGILVAGAAYVPIDPNLPQERFSYLLENSQADIVLTQSCLDKKLSWPERVVRLCIDIEEFASQSKEPLKFVQTPDDLAYVIYTSGSTGLPKGVMITHRNVVNVVVHTNKRFNVSSQDRILALTALNHDLSVYDIFGLLSAGGTIVMPEACAVKDPSHWAELMARERVTLWNSVPAMMEMLVDYAESHSVALPESLRLAIMGGDWLPVSLPNRLKSLVPGIEILSIGGPTETTIWNIGYLIEKIDPNWKSIPYGQPMANAKYYILNEALEDCPVWVPGEMYCAGVQLAKGYWRDSEKTSAKFITHPRTGEHLYRTGDLGRYLPDGNIEFLGRVDFQIKIRGYRIEAGEIEAALNQHPAVRSAVITAVGEEHHKQRLVAYIVPDESLALTDRQNLPDRKFAEAYEPHQLEGVAIDSVERIEFKLNQPGLRQLRPNQPSIELPKPELDEALTQAYLQRQSYRQFLDKPIPLKQFGQFLSCLLQMKLESSPLPKYRYASAGGLYPVQTYLYIKPNRVEGLEAGFYYYHPADHRLVFLTAVPEIQCSIYFEKNKPIFERSAFSLFLIGQLNALAPMYGELSKDFCLLEAGYISQLLMDTAPEYEIGLCPIGALEFEELRDGLQLESNQILLHSFVGGGIDLAWTKQWLQPTHEKQPDSLVYELRQFLQQKLPDYMVPSGYIVLDALPLTANGKVDRRALPAPESLLPQTQTPYVMPQTEAEQFIANLWQEVFQIDRVGIHDNFFELGGDSLRATQIISAIRAKCQVDLPLASLFKKPTVADLVEQIEKTAWTAQKLPVLSSAALGDREEGEL